MDAVYLVRDAVVGDLDSVLALDRETGTVPHWGLVDYMAAITPVDHGIEMPDIRRCFFVAEDHSGIVGFAVGTAITEERTAELESIAVAELARRMGVGRALCTAVIEWSLKLGAMAIRLEVRSLNEGAINLYRARGFVAVGLRPRYYREPQDDAVLMRLGLASEALEGRVGGSDL